MVSYAPGAKPSITWGHIDGPLLNCETGALHWLTWWEIIQFKFGWTNVEKLNDEYKYRFGY